VNETFIRRHGNGIDIKEQKASSIRRFDFLVKQLYVHDKFDWPKSMMKITINIPSDASKHFKINTFQHEGSHKQEKVNHGALLA
jgi:hypothetical protein